MDKQISEDINQFSSPYLRGDKEGFSNEKWKTIRQIGTAVGTSSIYRSPKRFIKIDKKSIFLIPDKDKKFTQDLEVGQNYF